MYLFSFTWHEAKMCHRVIHPAGTQRWNNIGITHGFSSNNICLLSFQHLSERRFFFAWRFILNENILFWLTISYQKPFVFSVSVFCSQICTLKLNLSPKIGLTYAISIVKWFFCNFCLSNLFLLFFAEFELLMFHNNIVKISEKIEQLKLVENLPPSYLPYKFLHNFHSFLLWEKVKIFDFFENHWLE